MSDEAHVWYHLVLDWPTVGKGFLAGAAYSLAAWVYRNARRRRQEALERVQGVGTSSERESGEKAL